MSLGKVKEISSDDRRYLIFSLADGSKMHQNLFTDFSGPLAMHDFDETPLIMYFSSS
jgi:hypothetical protein